MFPISLIILERSDNLTVQTAFLRPRNITRIVTSGCLQFSRADGKKREVQILWRMSHFNVAFSLNVFSISAVKQMIKADHEGTSAIKCGMCENFLQSLKLRFILCRCKSTKISIKVWQLAHADFLRPKYLKWGCRQMGLGLELNWNLI